MDNIAARWALLKSAINRPLPKIFLFGFAVISVWDTAVGQFLPPELAQKIPNLYQVLKLTSGYLSFWEWVFIGMALLIVISFEYAYHIHNVTSPAKTDNATQQEPNDLISLKEAVIIAYEETRGTKAAAIAEGLNADDVLGYYAHALFNGETTLYGNHPPGRKLEPIPNEESGMCFFSDDKSALQHHSEKRNIYENLQIKRSDLDRRIVELKALMPEEAQPPVTVDWNFNPDKRRAQLIFINGTAKTIDGFELFFRSYRKADKPDIWHALVSLQTVDGKQPPINLNPLTPYHFEFAELKWSGGEGTIAILPGNEEERHLGNECGVKLSMSGKDIGGTSIELRLKVQDNNSISIVSWNDPDKAVRIEDPNRKWV